MFHTSAIYELSGRIIIVTTKATRKIRTGPCMFSSAAIAREMTPSWKVVILLAAEHNSTSKIHKANDLPKQSAGMCFLNITDCPMLALPVPHIFFCTCVEIDFIRIDPGVRRRRTWRELGVAVPEQLGAGRGARMSRPAAEKPGSGPAAGPLKRAEHAQFGVAVGSQTPRHLRLNLHATQRSRNVS